MEVGRLRIEQLLYPCPRIIEQRKKYVMTFAVSRGAIHMGKKTFYFLLGQVAQSAPGGFLIGYREDPLAEKANAGSRLRA